MKFFATLFVLALSATTTLAFPHYSVPVEHLEVLRMRANTEVNPKAVFNVECINRKSNIVFHDSNVAQLAICNGIAGSVTKCGGSPTTTIGQSRSAKFALTPTVKGATIEISKKRWEQCVRAARAVCPTGSMKGTCVGGGSSGDINFALTRR